MTTAPCPHCGSPRDLTHRISGDELFCAACNGWFVVRFVSDGVRLLACDAPVSWPKETRKAT